MAIDPRIHALTLRLESFFPAMNASPAAGAPRTIDPATGNIVQAARAQVPAIALDFYSPNSRRPGAAGITTESAMDAALQRMSPLQRKSIQVKLDLTAAKQRELTAELYEYNTALNLANGLADQARDMYRNDSLSAAPAPRMRRPMPVESPAAAIYRMAQAKMDEAAARGASVSQRRNEYMALLADVQQTVYAYSQGG